MLLLLAIIRMCRNIVQGESPVARMIDDFVRGFFEYIFKDILAVVYMYFLRAFTSRFITRFHWTFLTKINLMTYLLYMFILYTYILSTNECWILKMLNISVISYLLFIPVFVVDKFTSVLHVYFINFIF